MGPMTPRDPRAQGRKIKGVGLLRGARTILNELLSRETGSFYVQNVFECFDENCDFFVKAEARLVDIVSMSFVICVIFRL